MAKLPPGISEWTPHPQTGKPRYLVRWRDPDGKACKAVRDRLTDAKRLKNEMEADKHRGTYTDPAAGRELVETFARSWAKAQDWKRSTRQKWPSRLGRIMWALRAVVREDVRLCDVDQLALKAARAKLATRYVTGTVAGDMHLLMAIMQAAVANGKLARDPTTGVDAAPKRRQDDTSGRVTPDMVPIRAEALAILAGAPSGWRAAIALGLAGCRVGEVLGMRKDRLQLDDRQVTVDAQALELRGGVVLTTTKNEKDRTITVPALVALELRRHLREGHGGTWVDSEDVEHEMLFRRPDGALWWHGQFYDAAWRPALTAAGLGERRYRFHSLRHHCASTLLAEGCPLPAVAGYLGDHQQTVMRVYSHWMPDDAGVPAAILDRVLAPDAAAPSTRHGDGTDGR
jgi:integrase